MRQLSRERTERLRAPRGRRGDEDRAQPLVAIEPLEESVSVRFGDASELVDQATVAAAHFGADDFEVDGRRAAVHGEPRDGPIGDERAATARKFLTGCVCKASQSVIVLDDENLDAFRRRRYQDRDDPVGHDEVVLERTQRERLRPRELGDCGFSGRWSARDSIETAPGQDVDGLRGSARDEFSSEDNGQIQALEVAVLPEPAEPKLAGTRGAPAEEERVEVLGTHYAMTMDSLEERAIALCEDEATARS